MTYDQPPGGGQPWPQQGQPYSPYPPQQQYPPPGYAPQPQYPPGYPPPGHRQRKSWPGRHKFLTVLGGLVALIIIGSIAAATGGGSSTQVVQGQVLGGTQAAATAFSALGGGSGICGGAVEGTQVIVKGPSGTLLATTTLHKDAKATSALGVPSSLSSGQVGMYDFSATIPAGSGPYIIELVGVSSLVVSASQLPHLRLTC